MIEFYRFTWQAHIIITIILGACVLFQTTALTTTFYRDYLKPTRAFKSLFEISILGEMLVFALLHGKVISGYSMGIFLPPSHEKIRFAMFLINLLLLIINVFIIKNPWSFIVIPASLVSLPMVEKFLGSLFPWFFLVALFVLLIRSILISRKNILAIKNNVSALSIVHALDTLETGILFCHGDGYIIHSNYQMQKLMVHIKGRVFRNGLDFYHELFKDKAPLKGKNIELQGQKVYVLSENKAWIFSKKEIKLGKKTYIHISAADISKFWELTINLQDHDRKLREKSDQLKNTIANLHNLSKEKEIENAKMRAHDILGQRLSVLLRMIQSEKTLDYDLLTSLSKGLLKELKAEEVKVSPYGEIKNIQGIFNSIGVDIKFYGKLPDDLDKANLFVDIISEASTNAVRHGFASRITIKSEILDGQDRLTINNNGYVGEGPLIMGGGISLMKKKTYGYGGRLDIKLKPEFTLSVSIPGGD